MAPPELVSFVVRFARDDAAPAAWHGRILHVQSNEEQYFITFEEAVAFMQGRLSGEAARGHAPAAPKPRRARTRPPAAAGRRRRESK